MERAPEAASKRPRLKDRIIGWISAALNVDILRAAKVEESETPVIRTLKDWFESPEPGAGKGAGIHTIIFQRGGCLLTSDGQQLTEIPVSKWHQLSGETVEFSDGTRRTLGESCCINDVRILTRGVGAER